MADYQIHIKNKTCISRHTYVRLLTGLISSFSRKSFVEAEALFYAGLMLPTTMSKNAQNLKITNYIKNSCQLTSLLVQIS